MKTTKVGIRGQLEKDEFPIVLPGEIAFGMRYKGRAFIPDTATVQQLREVMYWAKGHGNFGAADDGETSGIEFKFWIKPEYAKQFTDALITAGGRLFEDCEGF